ncbi:HNH endonuclease [Corynebacterium phoceense]|uniref:HNH endonuclease n=1 Tax=Corynebacterium phoceense TaxID=1686286 RepID=UPI003BF4FC16
MAWDSNNRRASTPQWRRTRQIVFARDGHTCAKCGAYGNEVDHIDNRRGPGYDSLENLQVLCTPCHKAKTTIESQRARGMKYKRRPLPPLK